MKSKTIANGILRAVAIIVGIVLVAPRLLEQARRAGAQHDRIRKGALLAHARALAGLPGRGQSPASGRPDRPKKQGAA